MPHPLTWQVGPLASDEAIKLLNEKFACFAPGWYINDQDVIYQDAWKRFYLDNARSDEGSGWLRGTQLVLMTSTGRLLEGDTYDATTNTIDMARGLQQVLEAYAKLPENQRPHEFGGW